MEIHRLSKVDNSELQSIDGTTRFYFDTGSSYDLDDFANNDENNILANGPVKGAQLKFFDTKTNEIFEPLAPENNVFYDIWPIYFNKKIYFMQGDFNKNLLTLYSYLPGKNLEILMVRTLHDLPLGDLFLHPSDSQVYLFGEVDGEDVDDTLQVCYYPQKMVIREKADEAIQFIHDKKVYFDECKEVDDEDGNWIRDEHWVVVKDFNNKIISREKGYLQQLKNGQWWIA